MLGLVLGLVLGLGLGLGLGLALASEFDSRPQPVHVARSRSNAALC